MPRVTSHRLRSQKSYQADVGWVLLWQRAAAGGQPTNSTAGNRVSHMVCVALGVRVCFDSFVFGKRLAYTHTIYDTRICDFYGGELPGRVRGVRHVVCVSRALCVLLGALRQLLADSGTLEVDGRAPAQVTRDFVGEITTAKQLASNPAEVDEAHRASRKRQRAWLARSRATNEQGRRRPEWRPPKRYRVASCRGMMYIDRQLQVLGHPGLGLYKRKWSEEHWASWPSLTLCLDQESCNTSIAHFLWYSPYKANIDVVFDPSHGSWNDVRLASKDAQWFGWLLGMLLVWNLPHGPWQDDVRSSQCLEMLKDFGEEAHRTPPPLLASRSYDVLADNRMSATAGEEGALQGIWDDFRWNSCFLKKGSKVLVVRVGLGEVDPVSLSCTLDCGSGCGVRGRRGGWPRERGRWGGVGRWDEGPA